MLSLKFFNSMFYNKKIIDYLKYLVIYFYF
jgi:hypothetical protein